MSISQYLELPQLDSRFPFRCFIDYGRTLVYPHWHKEIEFIYVIAGSIRIGVDDQLITLNQGEIYFFDSGITHYFLASPESRRLVYQFDIKLFNSVPELAGGEALKHIFRTRENLSTAWPAEVAVAMQEFLNGIYDEEIARRPGYLFATQQYLFGLVTLLTRSVPRKAVGAPQTVMADSIQNQETLARLDQIFAYIESHYDQGVTLEEVAQVVGFNPHYFTRFFKRNTGTTFMAFLTEYRLAMAKSILATETLPMIEVAERAGFNSVKTFHHVFKEQVGMSPLKYQKSISGN